MNKTKIEYCDYTWNPVTGCEHGCSYCYARKIAMRFTGHFKPEFHLKRLTEPLKVKKPSTIFVCSMADLFGNWVEESWINSIIETISDCPQHTFLFLTKNPVRYNEFLFPDNCWVGYTDDGLNDYRYWSHFKDKHNKFVSYEPLLGDRININFGLIRWVIVGALTGQKGFKPNLELIKELIRHTKITNTALFLKNNLLKIYPELPKIQQTPFERRP